MTYWRMQLHPADSSNAVKHTMTSIGKGFIGLDFKQPPGDLTDVSADDIPVEQRDYWDFAHKMDIGDYVLIIACYKLWLSLSSVSKFSLGSY